MGGEFGVRHVPARLDWYELFTVFGSAMERAKPSASWCVYRRPPGASPMPSPIAAIIPPFSSNLKHRPLCDHVLRVLQPAPHYIGAAAHAISDHAVSRIAAAAPSGSPRATAGSMRRPIYHCSGRRHAFRHKRRRRQRRRLHGRCTRAGALHSASPDSARRASAI